MAGEYPNVYLYKRIVQAKLFVDNHFNEPLDLSHISDESYFSKFHFVRLFKKIYGKTPHQYLTSVRIENAKKLLQRGSAVEAACHEVGFESVSSFTGLFKRLTRSSPSEFQRQFVKRQQAIRETPLEFVPNCFAERHGWSANASGAGH